ncbi:Uncharacterized protein Fot_35007 [Forsythia ovata]|uniref:Uncharacterized protein n=1 Tax=Forsythia ovata TaxID=205694 RepID=A0ABD1SN55_9LAMI
MISGKLQPWSPCCETKGLRRVRVGGTIILSHIPVSISKGRKSGEKSLQEKDHFATGSFWRCKELRCMYSGDKGKKVYFSDADETSYDCENSKESASPHFQAILCVTSAPRKKVLGDIKSFSHELNSKGVRPYPIWKPRCLNNLEMDFSKTRLVVIEDQIFHISADHTLQPRKIPIYSRNNGWSDFKNTDEATHKYANTGIIGTSMLKQEAKLFNPRGAVDSFKSKSIYPY